MKTNNYFKLGAATMLFVMCTLSFQAQETPSYKEMVVENPTAEADIKTATDYINAVVSGDMEKAESMLAETYMGYGPSISDSTNTQQLIQAWKEGHKMRTNEKVSFISQTFQVKSGPQKGNWVSNWGQFNFSQNGKDIVVPFQMTLNVENGKFKKDFIYFDNLAIAMAQGFTLTPPEEAK